MKSLFPLLAFLVLSTNAFAARSLVEVQECKDNRGTVLTTSMDSLSSVMRSRADRPQVYVTGVVIQIQPEDHSGLPHQKYVIRVNNQVTLQIVSNLDFGRVPLTVGATLSVCGEFKRVGQGMVHWTHFDPHGSHPDGFTIVDGKLYGDQENSYQNR
jgi:hypothetical protein